MLASLNPYYIKDSLDFIEKIKNVFLPENYVLISLDVVILYTNIPNILAQNIIIKKWDKFKKYTDKK